MKICLMTNTYLPHVGGVARSVSTFAEEFRRRGHEVLVVAPQFEGRPLPKKAEAIVERVAAVQNFNGSDFSVRLPLAAANSERLAEFQPDIVHAHHPFLLGDTALRIAASKNAPIVFTHHTRYEDYTHYVPFDSPALKQAAISLSTEFANLCDGVIAPSQSIARLIRRRGVKVPVAIVPTGIEVRAFARGDGKKFRRRHGLPADAFVVGHVGRLAPEKNLGFLAESVARFLRRAGDTRFLVVGDGPAAGTLKEIFTRHGLGERLVLAGKQVGRGLCDAYRAMDVFAFASRTETQGMVVTEAMAAGCPVIALDAPGVREVVADARNGFLLPARPRPEAFAAAVEKLRADRRLRRRFAAVAAATADQFSVAHCADRALEFYDEIRRATRRTRLLTEMTPWGSWLQRAGLEWDLLAEKARAVAQAMAKAS